MPADPATLQQQAQQYLQNNNIQHASAPEPGNFAQPKTPEQQTNDMPNSSKLTKFEKGVYGALPGISTWMSGTKIMGLSVSDQLDKFNKSLVGKSLNYLDIGAEGIERTSGLATQMLQPGFNPKDLKAAWYAGSLTYDMSNLPELTRDANGAVTGMRMAT